MSYPTHIHELQTGCKLRKSSFLSYRQKDNSKALSYSTLLLQSYVLPLEIFFVLPWLLLHFISTLFLLLAREDARHGAKVTDRKSRDRNEPGK